MRKVEPAPQLPELLEKYKDSKEFVPKVVDPRIKRPKSYYHWDKLRFLKAPEGMTPELWWMSEKIKRFPGKKNLPFEGEAGLPFSYVLTDEILKRLHQIDGKAKGYIGADQNIANEAAKDRFIVTSLIEEAITSSQLEGASTTTKVASAMIRSGRKPRDKHERMIVNNYHAMKHIQRNRSEPLTIESILRIHEVLTEDTLDDPDDAGRIQSKEEVRVVVGDEYEKVFHKPPPAIELQERLKATIKFANGETESSESFLHPILRAIILHFIVGYDHPFVDGNGRIARALFYHSALRSGYTAFSFLSISQIIKKAPAKYGYAYQYVETDDNDVTYFIHHQLEVICRAIENLESYTNQKQAELRKIENQLKTLPLNYRQVALLSHAIRHPRQNYSIRSHRISHDCAYATARSDLLILAELGLLEQRWVDQKTLGFSVPQDLANKIKSL